MAKLIGVVSKVVGQVFAVGSDGHRRLLVEGDRLFVGEQLETGAAGAVAVHLHSGAELTLGRDSNLQLTPNLLAVQAPLGHAGDTTPSAAQLTDVERMQQAIAAGADPTQQGEAPAAGVGNGNLSGVLGGGHSFVLLTEVGGRVDPTIGFPTAGFNGFPELDNRYIGGQDTTPNADTRPTTSTPVVTPPVIVPDHPVTLSGLDVQGGELTLFEKNLADGSAPDASALTQRGTFILSAPDGLQSLSVGGIAIVSGGVAAGFPQSITTALGNTLTITGYNPATGVVSYSYTLQGSESHAPGDGTNSLAEHFSVTATDSNGSSASGMLDVNIVDDVPNAHRDFADVTEGGTVSGNVLANDVIGADVRADHQYVVGVRAGSDTSTSAIGHVGEQIMGLYGYLTLDAQGNSTYHANPNLDLPAWASDTFVYTIRDADGDESTTTITVSLHDSQLLAGSDSSVTVYEKALDLVRDGNDLAAGNVTGSDPTSTAETASGSLAGSVTGGSGALTFTLVGNAVGQYGQIQLNADGSYTYTLTSAPNSPNHINDGPNVVTEAFTYQVKDALGNSTTSTIVINIVDDVPKAHCDYADVTEGGTVSGNVLANDVIGADVRADHQYVVGVRAGSDTSTSAIGHVGEQIMGLYGYLTLDSQGNGTYHANPNLDLPAWASDTFVYTIRDADGDESTATIHINVHDSQLIASPDSEVTVYEKALDLVRDGNDLAAGNVTGSDPTSTAETASGSLAGSVTGGVGALTFTLVGNAVGQYGQIQLNADGSYTYTLTSAPNSPNHINDGPNVVTEAFTYQVKDALGNSTTSTIVINIVDDVPKAHCDYADVTEGGTVSGNVLANDVIGADVRADHQYVVGVRAGSDTSTSAIGHVGEQIMGLYGYLTLDSQGNGTYHANPNLDLPAWASDTFVYTIRDADGDESTATIHINVHDSQLIASPDSEVTVYEKALDLVRDGNDLAAGNVTGSDPTSTAETASGSLAGSVTGGSGALTFTLVGNAVGQYGQIQLNADGSYTYTLTSAPNSPNHINDGPNVVTEAFTYQVKDALGNSTTSTIVINIVDDVPKAHCDYADVTEGGTVSGNVLANDVIGADVRADHQYVVGVRAGSDTSTSAIGHVGEQIMGLYGYLTLDSQGNGTYHANPNLDLPAWASDTFVYTIRDADGDESTATIHINVHDSQLIASPDSEVTVYEKALDLVRDGNDLAAGNVTGSDPTSTAETASGSLAGSVTGGSGALTFTLVGNAVGQYGQIQLNADGSYTYTLTSAPNSPNHINDGPNVVTEAFTYQVKDALGNSTTSTIVINIVDDVPKAHCDYADVTEGGTVSGNVLANDVIGADVRADHQYVVGVRAGSDTSTSAIGHVGEQIMGLYGYLTLDSQGNGTYHANPNLDLPAWASDTFVYTIRDADGDESTATIHINVHDSQLIASPDSEVTVYEKALDLVRDGNDLAAGNVTGSDPTSTAETASGSLAGSVTGGVGALTFTLVGNAVGQYGQIQLNADGSYTYTLTSAPNSPNHINDGPNVVTEAFTYQVKDALGNSTTSTIVINIVDDVPKAHCDYADVTEGGTVSGNVLANDVIGADVRADHQYVVGVRAGSDTSTSAIGHVGEQIMGLYGYLTLDSQGNGTYHANPNLDLPAWASDTFVYTIRDADGDESTATIHINVHDSQLIASPDSEVTVYEKALDLVRDGNDLAAGNVTGSDPTSTAETASGSLAGSVTGGVGALTFTLVGNAVGQYGQIQLNADGSYTYTLTSAPNSPNHINDGPNVVTEAFTYQVKDALGNSTTSTIVINIVDDVPKAHCDYADVTEGGTVSGNVLANDVIGADVRADHQYVVGVRAGSDTSTSAIGHVGEQIMGLYGYLTLDSQGNGTYHANPNLDLPAWASDTFVYTIRDADGDESTATIHINVHDSQLIASPDSEVTVYEKALDLVRDGNDLAAGNVTGSDPTSTAETASGSLAGSVTGGSGALTFTLVGNAVGQYGQIQLNPDGSYTYTLTSAPKTPGGADDGANIVTESFTYKATDAQGNSVTSSIVINIVDDVPQTESAVRSITPSPVDSNLLLVIDVSGSMNDASGVQGLTRLALAKQAINSLLDRYDAMGEIKVQIVTFSSGATAQSPVWVSISEAKSIVAGLSAGGATYYDAAATKAQQVFASSGKLEGAQNVAYFFSDGAPSSGHGMTAGREATWESFLDSNGIKSYAIGLGAGVNEGNLNPLAYDGSSHVDTNSVVVTDLGQLSAVLSGTVQGAPVTGSLMSGGTFGADGGFIKALLVDGITYTYDPKANAGHGGYTVSGGVDKGLFDSSDNSLIIRTGLGGSLRVAMDSGEFTYTPPKDIGSNQVEKIGFVAADNDGDTSAASLTINVNSNGAPVAVADHIITNIAGSSLSVPAEALLANDSDPDHDRLSASPITFNTGFADKGAGFTVGAQVQTVLFDGVPNKPENQFRDLARSEFTSVSGSMTAALVVVGYLGVISSANANDEDTFTVTLHKGETLTLDHDRPAGNLAMEWKEAGGSYQAIADGGSFTASHDGVYSVHLVNTDNAVGNSKAAENYKLSLVVDYSNATNEVIHDSYNLSDGHGGTATGAVDITYQAGHTLTGTSGDDVLVGGPGDNIINGGAGNDVLVAGPGNDHLYGGDGNDLLIAGPGNDLLDGGAGINTASFARASAGVVVDLSHVGVQNTVGAGMDTLVNIANLIGSNYNDTLIGNDGDNVLNGGAGNDVLKGGAGNDTLIGGPGDDVMTGGPGNDTFVWQKGDTGHDTVTDFTPGSDHLDLSQLLQGENATSASLDDYLHFKVSGTGSNVVSTIEVSSVAGAAPTQTIDLAGVDLAQHYGVSAGAGGVIAAGHDTATIINGMLNDHSLKVDTV